MSVRMLTISQAAKALGLDRRTIERRILANKILAYRVPNGTPNPFIRIPETEVTGKSTNAIVEKHRAAYPSPTDRLDWHTSSGHDGTIRVYYRHILIATH